MKLKTIAPGLIIAVLTSNLHAASIFSESFDYGASDIQLNVDNATGWRTASSTRLIYDADAGLNVAQVNGETGGALGMPDSATTQTATQSFSYAMSGLGAGDTLWMSTLVQYVPSTNDHGVQFLGGSVTGLGFNITTAGTLQLYGSDDGGADGYHDTTVTGITSGTYLVLLRATKGTGAGTNDPSDSTIDIWFNPSDTSSVSALGGASFTTGADSKFGRNSQSFDTVSASMGLGGAIDEIRLDPEFSNLNLVPEPSTALLGGLGTLLLLRRRRD